jgi:hydrogenase maturation protein HypF
MAGFRMCRRCRREYADPADRRFHAQPIACPACGPALALFDDRGRPLKRTPLTAAAAALRAGRVVAIKGLGGFHLACNALDDVAVSRLRRNKARETKPLAVMVGSVATARRFCRVGSGEARLLLSPVAPIVLLDRLRRPRLPLSGLVAPANRAVGVMLPYSPLHVLLFDELRRRSGANHAALVMTSANRSEEPLAPTEEELLATLPGAADLILTHDRPIANRCDDSVVMVPRLATSGSRSPLVVMVRRSRGYAPTPLALSSMFHVKQPVLAVGAEMRSCFALGAGGLAYLSPHIGSVAPGPGERFFRETLTTLLAWTRIRPSHIACDLHPDYWSTRLAERLAAEMNLPLVRVQHHYAHVLSVMAEHGLFGPVVGLVCDGTGLGTDGAVWGCELLLVRPDLSWERVGHLGYLEHGEGAGELADPARVAHDYSRQAGLSPTASGRILPGRGRAAGAWTRTSSLGRLFDAVAGLTGVCRHVTFDGEAPAALEAAAHSARASPRAGTAAGLDPRPVLQQVASDLARGLRVPLVAARFHATLVAMLADAAIAACRARHTKIVCLSGGALQNQLLLSGLARRLSKAGHSVHFNQLVPLNDGGLALGQLLAAGVVR